ncbi:MAG TPA: thioredoxin-like domain-containing protein [Gemmataceae bacterium]|nr:thioredoxin-like domain-containing protein [Gemmataceae bacterium]
MGKARVATGLVAGWAVWCAAVAWAAPTPAQMLSFRPRQEGVDYSTPSPQEESLCKVEPVKWGRQGAGWLLRDPQGRPLRRFYNTRYTGTADDKSKIDVWSYYKDGVEVYREWATKNGDPPDQYRWFNSGGMKWGVDENKDGKIDSWKMISPEEVSQEILQALIKKDFSRLQALMLTEAEMKALELPAAEVTRIRGLQKQAAAKFQNTLMKLSNLSEKTHWLQLQAAAPQCLPADQTGAKQDLIRYPRATLLCETGDKSDWLQIGEMIQVGLAWRIIDAPIPGADEPDVRTGPPGGTDDPELQKLFTELNKLDQEAPRGPETPGPSPEMVRYNLRRADLLEKVIARVKPEEREAWIRQLADCLSAAAQSSPANDKTAYQRLLRLEEQIVGSLPAGSALAAYVTYREMQADYAAKIMTGPFDKVQQEWLDRLAKFVQTYPRADDTPDALLQLGWVSEMIGKETEAKNWYQQLAQGFPDKPMAAKARGALKRLDLEGKELELEGPVLGGSGSFNVNRLRGKLVVVYYWASWNSQCVGDFAKLKLLLDSHSKELELVCVNVDSTAEEALALLKKTQAPGTHLFTPGGLEGKLATDYGIMVLPNLFLVGKDGKVVSRTVQVNGLEEEVKKLLK